MPQTKEERRECERKWDAYRTLSRSWWQKVGTGPWEYRVVVQRPRLFHKRGKK